MSDPASIEHRHLRSAIEYAVVMGDEITKRKAGIPVPRELRAVAGKARIPTGALGRLRRAIDADESFRTAIAAGALPELVDPVGILWLQRPDGWQQRADGLIADMASEAADADLRTSLRSEEKRRRAAEQVAVRLRTDVAERDATIRALEADLDALRADVVKAEDEASTLRAELVDLRIEARHARDREAAAKAKLDVALGASPGAAVDVVPAGDGDGVAGESPGGRRQDVRSDEQAGGGRSGVDQAAVSELAQLARELTGRLESMLPAEPPETRSRSDVRRPLRLPGGVIASSAEAAEYLLRSDAAVLVDGYNVAKLAWPSRPLEAQRSHLLDAMENAARRFGSDLTVVFDGATVMGAHAPRRRLVRVVWSPEGVIADDVIRDEVRRLPATRPVVVVTNDAEIVADVKALGVNVVPSNAMIAVL